MSGVVDIGVGFPAGFIPGVHEGRLKNLGTLGADRLDILPDVPSTSEMGDEGMDLSGWFMMFAQVGVPDEVVTRVNER